ncbi:MAG: MFS transporter [Chloroflexi bacterium]|nr:MFS transporter [Chloroflexota bacterium]
MQTKARVGQRTRLIPPVFFGWYIVAAGMGIHLWASIAWVYGAQVFFTPLIKEFGWSRALISGAFALQRLEGSVAGPIEGFLVDRIGPRKIVFAGVVIMGLGLVFLGFIQALWMFYVGALVVSLGLGAAVGTPRTWAIVQWFRRLRGRALGIGTTGAVISGPLLIIVVWLVETWGWRVAFVALGVATWALLIPLALVFRARPEQYGYLPDGDHPVGAGTEPGEGKGERREIPSREVASGSLTVRQALRSRAFWVLTMVFGAQSMGVSALIVHLIPYFQSIHFSTVEAASVLGWFTVLSLFGRLGGGVASDYIDRRLLLAVILASEVAAFLVLANVTSYWQVFPFALLYGTSFGAMFPAQGVIVSGLFGSRNFGAIQGLMQTGSVLSGMVAPVLMGWIFDQTGSYVSAIYIFAAVAAITIPLTVLARPPRLPT